jgi:NitT/TauT family transport system ATP-binding protein
MSELRFEGVGREFGGEGTDFVAVRDVDLEVRPREFVCVVGPSGCGKSTLLNMAAGLLHPTRGRVLHRGEEIRAINTRVGYVTQKDLLLPWRTVERNVGLALEVQGVGRAERHERVDRVLGLVGLRGFERRYPAQLSGGMLKRASLAQTLVYEPSVLLMDEPFGALDAQLRGALQEELLALCAAAGTTTVFVTHDLDEAVLLGDRVVVFGTRPGRIVHVQDIPFARPRDLAALREDEVFRGLRESLWAVLSEQILVQREAA